MSPEDRLKEQARQAYSLGRLWWAAQAIWWVAPLCAIGVAMHCQPVLVWPTSLLAAITLTSLRYRGQEWARGTGVGFAAGLVALVVPATAAFSGVCALGPSPTLVRLCALGGFAAGLVVTYLAVSSSGRRVPFLLAAGLSASATAAIGCGVAGFSGILGMVAGVAIVATPAVLWARAR